MVCGVLIDRAEVNTEKKLVKSLFLNDQWSFVTRRRMLRKEDKITKYVRNRLFHDVLLVFSIISNPYGDGRGTRRQVYIDGLNLS